MRHVVSFSTGLSSALTVERVLGRYGRQDTTVVFMDTLIEDPDNYRFMEEMEARWELEIVILREGRDPYQFASDQNMIFNQLVHRCTQTLKIKPFMAYLKTLPEKPVIYLGIDYSEVHRCQAITRSYNAAGYQVDYPLLWKPIEKRPYPYVARQDWGIEPPRMYSEGYTHANCGGSCFAQGQGDWLRTLTISPGLYRKREKWEAAMRQRPGPSQHAILRDQSNHKVTPLTLQELRERYQSKNIDVPLLFELDYKSPCVVCGIENLETSE
jgi:hypothetical protein